MFTVPRSILRRLPAILPLVLFAGATVAAAQTMITNLPYTITAGGQYVLAVDFQNSPTSTTSCITISSPNVILDLGGHILSGSGNKSGTNAVISIGNYATVTIRNGLLANDAYGIVCGGGNSRNYIFENLTLTHCYNFGILVFANAPGSLIRNNNFSEIGGAASGNSASGTFAGAGVRFENSTVTDSTTSLAGSQSVGIGMSNGSFAIGNTITNFTTGISGGKRINNLTSGCATPFTGGTSVIGNN